MYRRTRRRGMAVVVVLALISVSLSLAYAAMRVQTTAEQIQSNSCHRTDARQAALTGLAVALRKMHQSDWAGVGTTLTGAISTTEAYSVTYTAGDTDLSVGHVKYSEYPYRVTILSTGTSTNAGTATTATHRVRAVVKLVPRALCAAPTDWTYFQPYTLTQRMNDRFDLHMPAQVRGTARIQGQVRLNNDYPNWGDAGNTYFTDLQTMVSQGTDCRPFTGAIHWNASRQRSDTNAWLLTRLGLSTTDTADRTMASWSGLSPTSKYRLYPGGPEYNVTAAPYDVPVGTTFDADPVTNPLGILYRNDRIRIWNNVTIRGTVISDGDNEISLFGTNVTLNPLDLPPLYGTTTPIRLPTVIADSMRQYDGGQTTVRGLIALDDELEFERGSQERRFSLEGKAVFKEFIVRERSQWDSIDWATAHLTHSLLLFLKPLYPIWMENLHNAKYTPKIIFAPDSTAVTYHWLSRDVPLFAAHAADGGLRWDIVSWKDNP